MPKWVWWSGAAGLVIVLGLISTLLIIPKSPFGVTAAAVALRKEYPYQSLRGRLSYESRAIDQNPDEAQPLQFSKTLERLKRVEVAFDNRDAQARLRSLQELHSSQVGYFLNGPRNGLSRWGRTATPDMLEYPEPKRILLTENRSDSTASELSPLSSEAAGPTAASAAPTATELEEFHLTGLVAFVDPYSLGDVRDIDRVAGFVSHGFRYLPTVGDPANAHPRAHHGERRKSEPSVWKVARLELVSLLKFETPRVYISDSLPQMKQIADAGTRALDPFEQAGLDALHAGQDLVTADGGDTIRMFGSLRAAMECLECHHGPRGKLLGAFSYELCRADTKPEPGAEARLPLRQRATPVSLCATWHAP